MSPRFPGRLRVALALALVGPLALAACTASAPEPGPSQSSSASASGNVDATDPASVAGAFAAGLRSGVVEAVPFAEPSAVTQISAAVAGMGDRRPAVTVGEVPPVEDDTEQMTVPLHYSWPITAQRSWDYDAALPLVKSGDQWRVPWTNAALAPGLEKGERLSLSSLPAVRGRILGAGGAVLVTDRPVRRVGIDRSKATAAQAKTSAAKVAAATGVDAKSYVAAVVGAGPAAYVEAITYRTTDPAGTKAIAALKNLPGVAILDARRSLGPSRTFARSVLGSVGEATAEIVSASGGTIRAGDLVGTAGVQKSADALLRGTPGRVVQAIASNGGSARQLFAVEAIKGADVLTSLDPALQQRAEAILAKVGPAASLVAVSPSTGQLKVIANSPGSDGFPTATLGQYAPGSTFKVITALALLRAGLTPASTIACTPTITVDGRQFKNYDAYPAAALGTIPLRSAFANSCNTAMIAQHAKVSQADLRTAAGSLGWSATPTVGVPAFLGEVGGSDDASEVDHAASMIGQGRVLASPLGMATVAASVAAGHAVVPKLVLTELPTAGSPPAASSGAYSGASSGGSSPNASATQTPSAATRPLTAAEAAAERQLMRAVVTEGSGRLLSSLGSGVLAKTGTAEYGDDSPPATHAWMLGVRGDLAVAVFVDTGSGGARTAGPLLKAFLAAS